MEVRVDGQGYAFMKYYAIMDPELDRKSAVGYLYYYKKANAYIIELCEDIGEWEAPLLFQGLVKKGIYTVSKEIALLWVRERVIPSGRQNIGSILKNAKLKEYNEMALLSLSKGKCSQDSCYIKEVSEPEIPENIKKRSLYNVMECFPTKDRQIICLFMDHTVRRVNLEDLTEDYNGVSYILKNEALFQSVKVGVGGYSIVFNDSIEIDVSLLRKKGKLLSISTEDFFSFINRNIVDTTTACDIMQCSRQNLSYLVKAQKLTPVFNGTKENLYTRGAIETVMNE